MALVGRRSDDPQDDIRSESSFDPDEEAELSFKQPDTDDESESSLFKACSTFWAREMKRLIDELDNGSDSDSNKSFDPADYPADY
jgi:hypothetical protein